MSKPVTVSTAKIPASQLPVKSAWTRGPPLSTASSSTPRSQSPSSANATQPSTPTHSRKPSALGGPSAPSATFRDGVSVPRSIQPPQKPATGLSFGSIAEPSAPLSSSPVAVPSVSSDASNVKSFGTIPASNGISSKPTLPKSPSKPGTPATPSSPSPASGSKPKLDVKSLFRNGTGTPSAPSPTAPSAVEGSPAQRQSTVPPSQTAPQPQTFYPSRVGGPTTSVAGVNSSGPRSPQYPRQMNNNGTGGRNAPSNSASLGPSSPRLTGMQVQHQQHQLPPHTVSHPQHVPPPHPGMQVQWPPYYYYPGVDPSQYMPTFPWQANPSAAPPMHPPPPPHTPTPHGVASPARPSAPMLHPTPSSIPPATPPTSGSPYPPPSSQGYPYPHSPPPPGTPQTPASRLSTQAPAFVPKQQRISSAIKIRNPENGEAVEFPSVSTPVSGAAESAASSTPASVTLGHQRKPTVVRLESEEMRTKRMEEQRAKEKQEKAEQELVAKRQREYDEKIRKRKEEEEGKRRKEEEERKKREEEERRKEQEQEQKMKEESERKEREEVERKEREEAKRKEREEAERREREKEEQRERERKEKEERERKEREKREEEERLQEEEERLRREEEEKMRLRLEGEERRRKEEEVAKSELERKAEEDAAAKIQQEEDLDVEEGEEREAESSPESTGSPAPSLTAPVTTVRVPSTLSSAEPTKAKRPVPGPLDLSATSKPGLPPSLPSALATARAIDNLDKIQYPEGILSPKPELNAGVSGGKFRYDRDFLLQFMAICKDKPDSLPALDAIGLEPADQTGSRVRNNSRSSMAPPSSLPNRSGIGLGGPLGAKAGSTGPGFMGQFGIGTGKLSNSEERFAASMGRSASVGGPTSSVAFPRATQMVRTASQGGTTPSQPSGLNPTGRTRSQRGGKHRDTKGGGASVQERERTASMAAPNAALLEPVEPLKASENRWTPISSSRKQGTVDADSPDVVERKVKALLNKLTMEKFDSISDQIIAWANRSEKEKDGRTLIQVIRLVFEKATDEAAWSEMYARLCRKMMEQISQKVQDDGIRSADGKPIAGGQLFRKYLLNRCQEDFERGWSMKEAAAKAAESKAADDKAMKDAADEAEAAGKSTGEEVLYSDEYYAAQKAKRRGLGLVKFIGELFKLQMLTERIMHECIKKLLGNVENPEEEEIESLCKLLSTVGCQLDTEKARNHMDVYFERMKELSKSQNITSRMQFMLLDVLELRGRQWVSRNIHAAPTTIAAVHEQAAKDQAKAQSEQSLRSLGTMSRGGSRRGEQRSSYGTQTVDGWTSVSAPRPVPTAGDLTQFGKISKGPLTFGPTSVFAKNNGAKGREGNMPRTNSTSNMFNILNSDAAAEPPAPSKSSRPPSRKPSADFTQSGIPEASQRKKLALLPRTKPVPGDTKVEEEEQGVLDEEQVNSKIEEDLKEFWAVRDLDEADAYLPALPATFRVRFLDKLIASALDRKEADAKLLAQFLKRASDKGDCSSSDLEEGFLPHIENIDDIAIDAPAAYKHMAILLKGSNMPKPTVEELSGKIIVDGDPVDHPRDRLLREYEKADS